MSKRKVKKWVVFGLALVFLGFRLWQIRAEFQSKFDFAKVKAIYDQSQFNPNVDEQKQVIQDWDLYPLAGMIYLESGDLSQVNVEHPPLGKYLLGLTAKYLGSPNLIQLPLVVISFWLVFKLVLMLSANVWLAGLTLICLAMEPLLINNVTKSLLDLMLLTASLAGIYLIQVKAKPGWIGLMLGIIAMIKYPMAALILLISLGVHWLVNKQKDLIKNLVIVGLTALIVALLSYSPLILKQGFSGLFRVQEKALRIHLSHVPEYPKLGAGRTMLLNQWPVWFDREKPIWQVEGKTWMWPLLVIAWIISPLVLIKRFKKMAIFFSFTWVYFISLNLKLFFPNYLIEVIPLMLILLSGEIKILIDYATFRIHRH